MYQNSKVELPFAYFFVFFFLRVVFLLWVASKTTYRLSFYFFKLSVKNNQFYIITVTGVTGKFISQYFEQHQISQGGAISVCLFPTTENPLIVNFQMFGPHVIPEVQKMTSSNSCCYCLLQIKHHQSHTLAWPYGNEQLAADDQLYCEFLERTTKKHKVTNSKLVRNEFTDLGPAWLSV